MTEEEKAAVRALCQSVDTLYDALTELAVSLGMQMVPDDLPAIEKLKELARKK